MVWGRDLTFLSHEYPLLEKHFFCTFASLIHNITFAFMMCHHYLSASTYDVLYTLKLRWFKNHLGFNISVEVQPPHSQKYTPACFQSSATFFTPVRGRKGPRAHRSRGGLRLEGEREMEQGRGALFHLVLMLTCQLVACQTPACCLKGRAEKPLPFRSLNLKGGRGEKMQASTSH